VTPLSELPIIDHRNIEYHVESVNLNVTWDPSMGDDRSFANICIADLEAAMDNDRKTIKTWRIFVWDAALSEAQREELRLFPEVAVTESLMQEKCNGRKELVRKNPIWNMSPPIKDRYKYIRIGGPLDSSVCPIESDVARVAAEACSLPNKYTMEIHPTPD
jgi:hypothetical protein